LRCSYCDTSYAFSGGKRMEIDEVVAAVRPFGCPRVCVTGGEPLAQAGCLPLLDALVDAGFRVSLETSGALDISGVHAAVEMIVDLKTPGSGEEARNRYENLEYLKSTDQVKFVITDHRDYVWAKEKVREHGLTERCAILFSPAAGSMPPAELAEAVLRDRLPVRFQIQLHKVLWGDRPGV
jgi:7-carboxy-7-deazaguanine synthase